MKTSSKKVFALVGVGAVTTGALGLGVWALVSSLSKNDVEHNVGDQQVFKFEYSKADGTKVGIQGLEIGQYETKMPDGTYDYFLNQEGIDYMVKRFFETGNYGPEIFNLKKIWVGNVMFTDDHENGMYVPDTAEIGLNARNDAMRLLDAANGKNVDISSTNWDSSYRSTFLSKYAGSRVNFNDQKVRGEMVFQTLLHEYGHHMAHSYFSSPFGTTATTLKGSNYWNSDFISNFKSYLNYDKATSLNVTGSEFTNSAGKKNISIGEKFNSKDLWEKSNLPGYSFGNALEGYDDLDFYYSTALGGNGVSRRGTWALGKPGTLPTDKIPYELSYTYVDSTATLEYLYSQEELFTRKMLLASATTGSDAEVFQNIIKSKLRTDLFEEMEKVQTNFMLNSNGTANVVPGQKIMGAKFLADDPFATSTSSKDIMDLIDKHIGHASGDDISFIFNENQYKVIEKGKMATESQPSGYKNNVKFGGYITNNNLNCIVALNQDGSADKKDIISNIDIVDFNLGYKTNAFDGTRTKIERQDATKNTVDQYTYATSTFVPYSRYASAVYGLAFAHKNADGTIDQITPIESFRGMSSNTYGLASNYLENQPDGVRTQVSPGKFSFIVPKTTTNGKITLGTQLASAIGGVR